MEKSTDKLKFPIGYVWELDFPLILLYALLCFR